MFRKPFIFTYWETSGKNELGRVRLHAYSTSSSRSMMLAAKQSAV